LTSYQLEIVGGYLFVRACGSTTFAVSAASYRRWRLWLKITCCCMGTLRRVLQCFMHAVVSSA